MNKRERTFRIEDVDGRGGRERCNWDSNELRDEDRQRRQLLKEQQQLPIVEKPKS
jgi:hypothetical protein